MTRMKMVVEKERNRYLLNVERSPSEVLSQKLINEALYGSLDGGTLRRDVTDLKGYDELAKWDSSNWVALLER